MNPIQALTDAGFQHVSVCDYKIMCKFFIFKTINKSAGPIFTKTPRAKLDVNPQRWLRFALDSEDFVQSPQVLLNIRLQVFQSER